MESALTIGAGLGPVDDGPGCDSGPELVVGGLEQRAWGAGGLVGPTDTCGGGAIVLGQAEVQGGGEGHVAKGGRDGAGPDAAGVS